jgi:hypothetical protein
VSVSIQLVFQLHITIARDDLSSLKPVNSFVRSVCGYKLLRRLCSTPDSGYSRIRCPRQDAEIVFDNVDGISPEIGWRASQSRLQGRGTPLASRGNTRWHCVLYRTGSHVNGPPHAIYAGSSTAKQLLPELCLTVKTAGTCSYPLPT